MEKECQRSRPHVNERSAPGEDLSGDRRPLSEEGIRDFDHRVRDLLGFTACPGYVLEPLVAGVRTEIQYEQGALSSATLGEGRHRGEEVTRHVKTILTVPLSLSSLDAGMRVPELLGVWGIVYMESRSGCRTPVSIDRVMDTLVQPDLRLTARQPLNLFCHGVSRVGDLHARLGVRTHYELMLALQGLGLRVNRPHLRVCKEITELTDYSFRMKEDITRFPYEIHGALITLNPLERASQVEETAPSPFWVVAFGFGES